jgi:hypothetical protein
MIISNAFGIFVGNSMGKRIPERFIRWVAALIFIAFGAYGLYENLPKHVWSPAVVAGSLAALTAAMYAIARFGAKKGSSLPVCGRGDVLPGGEGPDTK